MLSSDAYLLPESLADALAAWRRAPDGSRLVAGATDLLPWAREGRGGDVHVPELIDVSRVAELDGTPQHWIGSEQGRGAADVADHRHDVVALQTDVRDVNLDREERAVLALTGDLDGGEDTFLGW